MVAAQGGDPRAIDEPERLPQASRMALLRAEADGFVRAIRAEAVGLAAVRLGAGRARAEDQVDLAAGVHLLASCGDVVRRGEAVAELHGHLAASIAEAEGLMHTAFEITATPPPPAPLVIGHVRSGESDLPA
jgi:thymidine phosphorylase